MASLWRHPKSKYWTACFTDHEGRQRKRSTKKTDRDDAMRIALDFEHAGHLARDGALTEAQCRDVLSDILRKATGEHIRQVATADFLRDWKTGKEHAQHSGTALRYAHTIKLFLAHLGDKAKRPITTVNSRDIQGFLNGRLKDRRSTKTVSVDIKTLKAAFRRACRHGLIRVNPADAIDLPKVVSDEREPFTFQQVKGLIEAAPSREWKTLILLGYYTSARLSDCAQMTVNHLNFQVGIVDYKQAKTGRRVIVPLHAELTHHLLAIITSENGEGFLCPSLAAKTSGGAHGLSATFKGIMKLAGIDTKTSPGMGHRQFSKLSFHSLRHSFNTALANAGISQEIRMKLTGHTTAAINTTYTHPELAVLKAAIEKLPSLAIKSAKNHT